MSLTEARMVWLRSISTLTSIPGEIDRDRLGRSAFTRSMTSMMFAPGCRRMRTTMARWPSAHPAVRSFSTLSTTVATSPSRTAAPAR